MLVPLIVLAHGLVVIGLIGWLIVMIRRELRPSHQREESTAVPPKMTVAELRQRHRADEPRCGYNRSSSTASNHGGAA